MIGRVPEPGHHPRRAGLIRRDDEIGSEIAGAPEISSSARRTIGSTSSIGGGRLRENSALIGGPRARYG